MNIVQSTFISRANSQQLKAIQNTEGALLIIAGPGSGKTFTLVKRIVYLITHKAVKPENLLVVTFTDKAAQKLGKNYYTSTVINSTNFQID